MFVPPADRTLGPDEWRPWVAAQGFGQLVAAGRDRDYPVVVPLQFVLDGERVLAHLAAGNPMFATLEERPRAVLAMVGDWAFVPSAWKAIGDEDPALGIPTTYYAAVQLCGSVTVESSPELVARVLRRQLEVIEPEYGAADPEEAHRKALQGIRAIILDVEEVRAKFKYGGNVDAAHRHAVVERLEDRGRPGDEAAAAHTLRRLRSQTEEVP